MCELAASDCIVPIEFRSHFGSVTYVPTIHQPKSGRDGGSKRDAIIDEGQWRRSCHILPLRPRCSAFKAQQQYNNESNC